MDWIDRYKQQLEQIFEEAQQRIGSFPKPLNTIGLVYADKFHPVKHMGRVDYICTLLPFWMKDTASISDAQCARLALANVYGMLYFFIQDDVMDSAPSSNGKEQLALGNLLLLEMFSVFRELFPSGSPFWHYYNRYVATWADCVVNEDRDNYFITDPVRMAWKAGPVKIASTGALLLSGLEAKIPKLENAIDIILMTLQMSDDWADWKEDLAEGSYNGLLAMISASRSSQEEALTEQTAENAIYVSGCLKQYVQLARDNHVRLLAMELEAVELIDFHSYMLNQLNKIAERIDSNRSQLLKGGFEYLLSKLAINKEQ
ncbi:hypothetical protein [Paenibacillus sp. sgz302251]|uniref:hypothetical protein n=1 Tax=Paenibacillus sp. sgz302251 TaxID=3414493 RepID=UPI003C7DED15